MRDRNCNGRYTLDSSFVDFKQSRRMSVLGGRPLDIPYKYKFTNGAHNVTNFTTTQLSPECIVLEP